MERQNFEKSLHAFVQRKPFRPFMIRFVDGTSITVHHPEALVTRGGTAIYFDRKEQPTLFDHEGVSHLSNPVGAKSA